MSIEIENFADLLAILARWEFTRKPQLQAMAAARLSVSGAYALALLCLVAGCCSGYGEGAVQGHGEVPGLQAVVPGLSIPLYFPSSMQELLEVMADDVTSDAMTADDEAEMHAEFFALAGKLQMGESVVNIKMETTKLAKKLFHPEIGESAGARMGGNGLTLIFRKLNDLMAEVHS